ncbi:hypothetical protein C8R45DRAFT_959009 [Mycena sanguinolenta]|nr:hypothetical protein C8R45DRAFT_959009 [Mycena sanguinolenta]
MTVSLEVDASAVVHLVKQGFATAFIGFSLSTALYGVTILQVYLYYRNYPSDRILWKCVVALLFALDSLASAFAAHALYTYFVLDFGKSPVTDVAILWSFSTEKLLVTLITFVAQSCVDNCLDLLLIFMTIIQLLCQCCLERYYQQNYHILHRLLGSGLPSIRNRNHRRDIHNNRRSWHPTLLDHQRFCAGLAALDDLLITAVLCFHISHNRSGLPSTNQFVDTVILYTVSRGILTATTQILFLITNVAFPGDTYFMPFHMCVGKFYVNGVLCTLNIRQSFRQKTEPQFDTGPAFSFLHPEGTEQGRSQPHRNNTPNSLTGGTDNPENEPKPSNLKAQT